MKKIVFTGGGTVGHVTLNLLLIPRFIEDGWEVHFEAMTRKQRGEDVTVLTLQPGQHLRRHEGHRLYGFGDVPRRFEQPQQLPHPAGCDQQFVEGAAASVPAGRIAVGQGLGQFLMNGLDRLDVGAGGPGHRALQRCGLQRVTRHVEIEVLLTGQPGLAT